MSAWLHTAVKKLNRDVAKLDNFKRNLMQTLQDDDEGGGISDMVRQCRLTSSNPR
jgi:hypothetical protein